ncbi:hypothetical protein ACFSQT_27385 [Mesorhizobium calcicola]|uniref:Uncharacterized protein n=1 Tax=Mesorhizobium calcicola TaxID=1300310 RepID=A0ABW4WL10_9HYPH
MKSYTASVLGLLGWIFCSLSASAQESSPADQIAQIAADSKCATTDWEDRGFAKKAYFRGMALVFAKAICQPDRPDVKIVSAARGTPGTRSDKTDGLTWYDAKFQALGMSNATDGVDTLRHAYALLIGLGMRESSGKYCVGRDRSANFSSADSAEAGLFQTSWGAHIASTTMSDLFSTYKSDQKGCLLEVFSKQVTCSAWDARTWGSGTGADWQKLTKSCPAFAAEYAAVLLRTSGGKKGEFGPIRTRKAQVLPECDSMLSQIQALIKATPQICDTLK